MVDSKVIEPLMDCDKVISFQVRRQILLQECRIAAQELRIGEGPVPDSIRVVGRLPIGFRLAGGNSRSQVVNYPQDEILLVRAQGCDRLAM